MAFKNNMGGTKNTMRGGSAKVHMPAGSGSRPTTSKHGIETSAPKQPHKLHRVDGVKHLK